MVCLFTAVTRLCGILICTVSQTLKHELTIPVSLKISTQSKRVCLIYKVCLEQMWTLSGKHRRNLTELSGQKKQNAYHHEGSLLASQKTVEMQQVSVISFLSPSPLFPPPQTTVLRWALSLPLQRLVCNVSPFYFSVVLFSEGDLFPLLLCKEVV